MNDLRINGVLVSDKDIVSGFFLPNIPASGQQVINFSAKVADSSQFTASSTRIANIAVVNTDRETRTDSVSIEIAGQEGSIEVTLPEQGAVEGAATSRMGFLASFIDILPFKNSFFLIILGILAGTAILFLFKKRVKTVNS